MSNQRDYVAVVYNEQDRPLTSYPDHLARYLYDRYSIQPGMKLLDIGCGRGEFLRGFMRCGVKGYGADRSRAASALCPEAQLCVADLENDVLPFEDNSFDVVFSKSVIEHFYYPERMIKEIYRVLKPGALVITMCPDWEFNMRIYFEDYTHRTPFTLSSLRDIQLIHGFDDVQCERFRQLPILWKYPLLLPFVELTRMLAPRILGSRNKFIRFSKEIMLLSSSTKPQASTFKEIL